MRILIAFIAIVAAGILPVVSVVDRAASRPPPKAALEVAALGRNAAAGAVLWMMTVQQIGSDAAAQQRYPGLEYWLDSVFELNPHLRDAYVLGTAMLLTDADRAPAMQKILARGEALFPDDFQFPMLAGISAYFGELDAHRAAGHFRRAARMSNAPTYLASFADRLERDTANCGTMLLNLKSVAEAAPVAQRQFQQQAAPLYEKCLKRELEQAAAGFKLRNDRVPTGIDELLSSGILKARPPAPEGMCWQVINVNAYMLPCPVEAP